jgi:hypothetical protein
LLTYGKRVQGSDARRIEWPLSPVSSDQNAERKPTLHVDSGATVKPSLLKFGIDDGRLNRCVITKWPRVDELAPVSISHVDVRPPQLSSQIANSFQRR